MAAGVGRTLGGTVLKNVAGQKITVLAWDTALDEPKTGDAAQITAYISKDGGGAVQTNDVNPTELDAANMKGLYQFDATQAESNADLVDLLAASATANVKLDPVSIYTIDPAVYKADVSGLATSAALATHDGNLATHDGNLAALAAVVALEATSLAIKAKTDNLPGSPAATGDAMALTAGATSAQLVDDIWDEILTGATHNIPTSAGRRLREIADVEVLDSGMAQGGTASTIILAAAASALDLFYDHTIIVITEGTGAGQARGNDGYVGSTRTATVHSDWVVIPDSSSKYEILTFSETHVHQLENDVITALAFDKSTAFPVQSADAGATEIARTGADADTLETLSDQVDLSATATALSIHDGNLASVAAVVALEATAQAIKAKTDNLPADPAGISDLALLALEATAQAIKAKTDNLPASPAATGAEMALTAAALTAIADEIRDSKWTAGGVATVGFLLRCINSMAKGNFYRTGDVYTFYDDDDTGSKDGTLLFTVTISALGERTNS